MRFIICLIVISIFASCTNSDEPNVSDIKVKLEVKRFEKDFFNIDTTQPVNSISNLQKQYPEFTNEFLYTILNVDPAWSEDTSINYILQFKKAYKNVYDSAIKVFPNFSKETKNLEKSIQYLKYYFPKYKAPEKVITYIGPLDGYGDILAENAIIVGLHHHLGKNFSLYRSSFVNETYPEYITSRFEPQYIPINAMKNIITDMYPSSFEDQSLIVQMVEAGKKLYVLSKLVPYVKENELIGYTEKQMNESYSHEKVIWSLFTQNNLLQNKDINIIKNYIGESPKTMELGEASPGNIGSFAGWLIVKKYVSQNKSISLTDLMKTGAEDIYVSAKYKP
ncbi:MAG: hypothetical protein ABIP68_01935 [Ferruginibacter sp.]